MGVQLGLRIGSLGCCRGGDWCHGLLTGVLGRLSWCWGWGTKAAELGCRGSWWPLEMRCRGQLGSEGSLGRVLGWGGTWG